VKEKQEIDIEHFTIEGTIHGKAISNYIDKQIEVNKRKQRLTLVILALLVLLFFIWAAISQYKLSTMQKEIAQTNKDKKNIALIKHELAVSDNILDSLENLVFKLQSQNDYLAETSAKAKGVFFEVQIGAYSTANLNNYSKNLENINQTKQGDRNLLLMGKFRSFKQALLFEKELKQLGIENAFVVGRIDNKVVSYQEALNALNESNK
jgi:hypothetical protein